MNEINVILIQGWNFKVDSNMFQSLFIGIILGIY